MAESAASEPCRVQFTVYGVAAPAGSKTTGARKDGGRFVRDSSRRAAPWKADVARAAAAARNGGGLMEGPLRLTVRVVVPRPKGHYGAKGLRPSAPELPITRPDVTKLLRAIEDACTGIVWRDDAQIVTQIAAKEYGEPARAEIVVEAVA